MNISLDWYKIFCQVGESGNITNAAERLFISQPAVSQSIKQLETALGCQLFVRTPKGVTLTSEGETLFLHISKGIKEIQYGEKRLQAQLALEAGEIYIGASDMTLEYYLLPYLEEFHRQYPQIRISITNGPSPETIQKLEENRIDFGVISEPVADLARGVQIVSVKEIEDIFICGKEYAALHETQMSFGQLADFPCIMLESGTSTRKYIDGFLYEKHVTILPEFELATSSLIVQFTKRNLGIGCVVKDFANEELVNGNIYELQFNSPIPKRNICIVQKDTPVSKASETLLSLLMA